MQKDGLNVHVFQNRDWYNPKSDRWFFFYFEDLSIGRILSEKNGGTGLSSQKWKPELKVSKNVKYLDEISNNWTNDLIGANENKALDCHC